MSDERLAARIFDEGDRIPVFITDQYLVAPAHVEHAATLPLDHLARRSSVLAVRARAVTPLELQQVEHDDRSPVAGGGGEHLELLRVRPDGAHVVPPSCCR
ncbi:MAG: hypothetical protein ACYDCT_07985 [Dehalococcoidia bacterium]